MSGATMMAAACGGGSRISLSTTITAANGATSGSRGYANPLLDTSMAGSIGNASFNGTTVSGVYTLPVRDLIVRMTGSFAQNYFASIAGTGFTNGSFNLLTSVAVAYSQSGGFTLWEWGTGSSPKIAAGDVGNARAIVITP